MPLDDDDDVPYTTPDEDPFNVHTHRSLLDKWIHEQQNNEIDNYDLINDDDIPRDQTIPNSSPSPRTSRSSKLLYTPPSFRTLRHLCSSIPATSSPLSLKFSSRPQSSKLPTDDSNKPSSFQHDRSTSLSNLNHPGKISALSLASSPKKWRPSVLGHFPAFSSSQVSDTTYTPSRPSISSADTHTSGTITTSESELPATPSRLHFFDSIRFRSKLSQSSTLESPPPQGPSANTSTPALLTPAPNTLRSFSSLQHRSFHTSQPSLSRSSPFSSNVQSGDDDDDDDDADRTGDGVKQIISQRDLTRPSVAYSSAGSLPRVSLAALSSRHKKKKKLVVRGVSPSDVKKFEGVKRWCESFGEVSQIVRMPNGDLHVHFRLFEVAETVCRIRAKVCISGVGSVQLSWYTGDKR